MPLPKIATPKFPVTIPSTKRNTFFRPFLMKEQKVLYMAMHGDDVDQIFNAMCDIVENCVDGATDARNMPVFDLEYLFMRIRAKSVGEMIQVGVKCRECTKGNKVEINLDELEVEFQPEFSNKVMLNENLGIILRYPCMEDLKRKIQRDDADSMVKFVCDSIESVFDNISVWTRKDFSEDEIREFVESMSSSQLEKVGNFYANLPSLTKKTNYMCQHCKKEQEVDFRRLQDFFM